MRTVAVLLVAAVAAGCAGRQAAPEEARRASVEPGSDVRDAGVGDRNGETALDAAPMFNHAPAIPPPVALDLPPDGDGTWVAPEIRALAQRLGEVSMPPSELFYVGESLAPGCGELYTFRLLYGVRQRWADVAGFASAEEAAACGERVEELAFAQEGPFVVAFSDELAAEPAVHETLLDELAGLGVRAATPVPVGAVPWGGRGLDELPRDRPPAPAQNPAPIPR